MFQLLNQNFKVETGDTKETSFLLSCPNPSLYLHLNDCPKLIKTSGHQRVHHFLYYKHTMVFIHATHTHTLCQSVKTPQVCTV